MIIKSLTCHNLLLYFLFYDVKPLYIKRFFCPNSDITVNDQLQSTGGGVNDSVLAPLCYQKVGSKLKYCFYVYFTQHYGHS